MVRKPVETHLSFTPQSVSQFTWFQYSNSAYQASYAEIIEEAEKFCASENLRKKIGI
ncbi:hypothetical protein Gotur_024559 [Gossypium turneri]